MVTEIGLTRFRQLSPDAQVRAVRSGRTRIGVGEALRLLLMLGRPRTCVPGLLAYGLGVGFAGGSGSVLGAVLAFLVGFSANLHNTYTDVEEDARNLPGRMWLLYRFGMRRLAVVLVALNLFMALAALAYGLAFFLFVVVGLAGLHQYSFRPLRMKARPVLGLYVFAQAVVGPFLIGTFTGPEGMREPDWVMLAFLFCWFVAKGFFKNVPDYEGDRAAGLRTSATLFPSRRAAAIVAAAVTVAAYLALPLLVIAGTSPARVLFATPLTLVAALQALRLVRAPSGAAANDVLRADMVLSSVFLAAVLLLQDPNWTSAALVLAGAVTILGSDLLSMDSRRSTDTSSLSAPAPGETTMPNRPATPQELFDRVAPRYDLFNSLLSAGQDRRWRRAAARAVRPLEGGRVLDVATGTASLAIAVADAVPGAQVIGCDVNASMLAVARTRVRRRRLEERISLRNAPGEDLPFETGSFDAVCIAFAIDDMADRHQCAKEMMRVLRPGGRLVLLELGVPDRPTLRSVYLAGLSVMSLLARMRGMSGYGHLREEITTYRGPEAIRALLQNVGLVDYRRLSLTGGIAMLHIASAPPIPTPTAVETMVEG